MIMTIGQTPGNEQKKTQKQTPFMYAHSISATLAKLTICLPKPTK